MEWNVLSAQNLAVIDQEIGEQKYSLAEGEIIRRVVYATADLEYKSLLSFSHKPLKTGSAALAARTAIITDVPMVQVGIISELETTFSNPVYCVQEITPPSPSKNPKLGTLHSLAKRYPNGIFIVGQNQYILPELLQLVEAKEINPALIIATPPSFVDWETINNQLKNTNIPHIRVNSAKGGVNVAVAIFNGLIDLAWIAYQAKFSYR
jgi:precorrin-8X/cobalt-precorrin-8 methylmutase